MNLQFFRRRLNGDYGADTTAPARAGAAEKRQERTLRFLRNPDFPEATLDGDPKASGKLAVCEFQIDLKASAESRFLGLDDAVGIDEFAQ
jgi:hypothetical protein